MSFLFSMLTADAASAHGHEFNTAASPASHKAQRLPIPRSPLSVLPRARSPNTFSRRPRPHSMKITMAELKEEPGEDDPADQEEELRKIDAKIRTFTIPGAFQDSPPHSSPTQSFHSATELHPLSPIISASSETSELSIPIAMSQSASTDTTITPRSTPRIKHTLRFAPTHVPDRRLIRPKVLLQLQEDKPNSKFHRPVLDVVPGSRFTPRTKIGQKLRLLRRNKDGTNADDLVVLRSEGLTEDDEHDLTDGQDVLGTIQPAEHGPSAYIQLDDSSVFKGTLTGRGAVYEVECVEDPTQRIRWFIPKSKRSTGTAGQIREFNCALLLPEVRRHPVLARMSQHNVDYYDNYISTISQAPVEVDDMLRKLVLVSSIWVFFCEGWSKHYDFNSVTSITTKPALCRNSSMRSTSTHQAGLRGILRSPSRSPAPSIHGDCSFSASTSSDTRSREGSHDSGVMAAITSPMGDKFGTVIRRSTHPSQRSRQSSRTASPEPALRSRRRWSLVSVGRRLSTSIRHAREERAQFENHSHAEVLHIEHLPTQEHRDQHPLKDLFIPAKISMQATETEVSVTPERRQAIESSEVVPITPSKASQKEARQQRMSIISIPSSFAGQEIPEPRSSEEDHEYGRAAWWQQFDQMLKSQNPVPSSPSL